MSRGIIFFVTILFFTMPQKIFAQKKSHTIQSKNKMASRKANIQFDTMHYDFGMLMEGDTIFRNFTFKNIGNKPFEFTHVETSCNCTTVNYPFTTIAPKQSGTIEVRYISTNKMGNQKSVIKVKTNIDSQIFILSLSGSVWQKKKNE